MDEEKPLSSDQIKDNVDILKRKLRKDTSPLYQCLYSAINEALVRKLTWKNPLASQVISNRSELIQKLPVHLQKAFMKLAQLMKPTLMPKVKDMCREFITNTSSHNCDKRLPGRLIHDGTWKAPLALNIFQTEKKLVLEDFN
ncbi:3466_t:CDS:2 [Paraglomus brasilianum]|uniref:3466_t:CDS:1 n=1 Tax=Paraglomus brasilianum TaxID=144538 RepID=A0A9N8WNM1_9GLOM|nr:3466_t:CDS:2 [Paraglomus brasilianum]